jgi:RimJ/RimL family protein N-acetyltransferase
MPDRLGYPPALRSFADPSPIRTAGLHLEPLRAAHAEELAVLLDDERLHEFIGGAPASTPQLRERYEAQSAGWSPDGSQRWLNWVARTEPARAAVGTFQATVVERGRGIAAHLAWVVAPAFQRRGFAREGASAVASWLRERGVGVLIADIHPDHASSIGVALAVGLAPSTEIVDGEVRWIGS